MRQLRTSVASYTLGEVVDVIVAFSSEPNRRPNEKRLSGIYRRSSKRSAACGALIVHCTPVVNSTRKASTESPNAVSQQVQKLLFSCTLPHFNIGALQAGAIRRIDLPSTEIS